MYSIIRKYFTFYIHSNFIVTHNEFLPDRQPAEKNETIVEYKNKIRASGRVVVAIPPHKDENEKNNDIKFGKNQNILIFEIHK